MPKRIPVTILGATGVVGQRFAARLARHPWFEVARLAASDRSAGKRYADACAWRAGGEPYAGLGEQVVRACDLESASPLVFSALDAPVAREIEPLFANAGSIVFSNASAFRMEEDVPLLVPEVNAAHLELLELQRKRRGWSGAIVCNPNCTSAVLATALAPLHERFGVQDVFMVSMQALSGAGYPGVASLDALGNVVPFIRGEEEKVEAELAKMLGALSSARVAPAAISVSAMCHRVPVVDGHSEAVSVRLRGSPSPEEVEAVLGSWRSEPQLRALPTAPPMPVVVHRAEDRPQPRHDVDQGGGMSVHVGRVRRCALLGIKMFVLGNNLERGAAGASVLNAELMHARGMLQR
jgi:aspartate-semialdehyde dehydrogenase